MNISNADKQRSGEFTLSKRNRDLETSRPVTRPYRQALHTTLALRACAERTARDLHQSQAQPWHARFGAFASETSTAMLDPPHESNSLNTHAGVNHQ